jgi:hypothetical protein
MSAIQQQGRYSRHRWHHLSVRYQGLNKKKTEREKEKEIPAGVLSTLQGMDDNKNIGKK